MGGVDRGDQLRGYYSCRTKSRKFYKYIFYFLLDVTITNAYALYKNYFSEPTIKNVKDFVSSLQHNSLVSIVVIADLDVTQQLSFLFLCNTFRSELTVKVTRPSKREGVVPSVTSHTIALIQLGTVMYGCVTVETPQSDCFLLWHQRQVVICNLPLPHLPSFTCLYMYYLWMGSLCECVCVCACACMRACVRVCVRACVHVHVCVYMLTCWLMAVKNLVALLSTTSMSTSH